MIKDFEKELLSLTCKDLKLNIRNLYTKRDFDWLIRQTRAFAHWTGIKPVSGKGYNIYKKQRDDFNNGLSVEYFKVVTIGESHRYNSEFPLNTHGNQLRDHLMITYDINLNDLNRMRLFHKLIEKVYNETVKLKGCFDNSWNHILENKDKSIDYLMKMKTVLPSSPTLEEWNDFERDFLKKDVSTRGGGTTMGNDVVCELRTANNEVSYFTKDFFDDLTKLFEYRKDVLALIIRELEPINTKTVKPQEPLKGYDLGLSEPQLETLHRKLIDGIFLDGNTKLEHFKNAFNGNVLVDFEQLKWKKNYYASIFVTHHIEHRTPWQVAERVFNNGSHTSLKSGYYSKSLTLSDNQIKAKESFDKILRSLP